PAPSATTTSTARTAAIRCMPHPPVASRSVGPRAFGESRTGPGTAANGPSGGLAGELDDLARSEDRSLERLSRAHRADPLADLRKIGVGLDGDAGDRQHDVTTNHEVLPTDRREPIAPHDPHVPARVGHGDDTDQPAAAARDVEDSGQLVGDDRALEADPRPFALHQEIARALHGDDEPEAFAAAALRDDVAHDTDDLTGHVEHRAARVSRIDRGRRLEEFGE